MGAESKNTVSPVPRYQLKDGRPLYIVNKTPEKVAVFFNQTDVSCTLEIREK